MYELNYITKIGNIDTKLFKTKNELYSFVFSDNDIIVIYIYNFKDHCYDYIGNYNDILDYFFYKVRIDFLNNIIEKERECD